MLAYIANKEMTDSYAQCGALLIDDEADLRYARAGDHFVAFLECATEVLIVDFLHSRSDLPRQILAFGALKNDESDKR